MGEEDDSVARPSAGHRRLRVRAAQTQTPTARGSPPSRRAGLVDRHEIAGADRRHGRLARVTRRIGNARRLETFTTQNAGIATPAGRPTWRRIVTAVRQAVVDAKFDASANDLYFCHLEERRVNAKTAFTLDARFRRQVRQF